MSLIAHRDRSSGLPSLLGLPLELRNKIWRYAIGGMVFNIHCWPSSNCGMIATKILNRPKNFGSPLRTCRQVYTETELSLIRLNGFRFKNEDAIAPWIDGLETPQREAIAEIHLVTWRATHMVDGHSSTLKSLSDILPLRELPGLKKLYVEVRTKSSCRSCWHDCCTSCKPDLATAEARLKTFALTAYEHVDVLYSRQYFASFAGARVL